MSEENAFAVSAVILAGGQSRRLGRDKASLLLDGQPLLTRTVHTLSVLSDDLIVVTNRPEQYDDWDLPARFVPDERRGVGALMGVYSGLKAARHPRALALACDMPFLNPDLLRHMLSRTNDCDVTIPRLGEFLEPLHAIYRKTCLPALAALLEQNRRQIIAFFPQVRACHLEKDEIERFDPLHLSFVNVNTPENWTQVQELLAEQKREAEPPLT